MKRAIYLGLGVAVIVFGLMAFLPQRELAVDLACQPVGITDRLKATVQGERFWRRQVKHLDREIARVTALYLPEQVEKSRHEEDWLGVNEKLPELFPSVTEQSGQELEELIEARWQKLEPQMREMRKKIGEDIVRSLQICRDIASSGGSRQ